MKFSRGNSQELEQVDSNVLVKSNKVSLSKRFEIPAFSGLKENKAEDIKLKINGNFDIPENKVVFASGVEELTGVIVRTDEVKEVVNGKDESWDKLVSNVIIPTLKLCVDRVNRFIETDLREELKNSKPDIKD